MGKIGDVDTVYVATKIEKICKPGKSVMYLYFIVL